MNAPINTTFALSDRAAPAQILQVINDGAARAEQAGGTGWIGAIDALIDECLRLGACFSSGEIAAYIRTYRPDLRFSAAYDVGPQVRRRFQAGDLAYASGPALQVSRYTGGYSETSRGTLVFVYGPDAASASAHRFEVTAPAAGGPAPDPANLPAAPVQPDFPVQAAPARAPRARKASRKSARKAARRSSRALRTDSTALVHGDARLCIPRRVFQSLAGQAGAPVQGGDTVYVSRSGADLLISLAPAPGAAPRRLVSSRCRLLLSSSADAPFAAGARFAVSVTAAGLKLDTSAPL